MALVLSGSIDISGSMTATTILISTPGAAGMVSSSAQITELIPLMQSTASLNITTGSMRGEIAGIQSYTASLKGAGIVSSSTQIRNYNLFAVTSSANTFFGNQTISGSLNVSNGITGSLRATNGIISSSAQINGTVSLSTLNAGTEVKSTAYLSYRGSISLASGATGTIHTMDTVGLYTVTAAYIGSNINFCASAIFYAQSYSGDYVKCTNLHDGANITLNHSGASITVKNDGFGTYDFAFTILFQPGV